MANENQTDKQAQIALVPAPVLQALVDYIIGSYPPEKCSSGQVYRMLRDVEDKVRTVPKENLDSAMMAIEAARKAAEAKARASETPVEPGAQ